MLVKIRRTGSLPDAWVNPDHIAYIVDDDVELNRSRVILVNGREIMASGLAVVVVSEIELRRSINHEARENNQRPNGRDGVAD
jgi:hypothetical protein